MNTTHTISSMPVAESAISRIKAEHRALACILGALRALVTRYREPDSKPDLELFDSMLRYIENVPDRLHHPREDQVLFPALALRTNSGKALVQALECDHAQGERMLGELRHAFQAFCDASANALNGLATAVDEFAEFYWYHMRREENELLPLAEEYLTAEDWQRVDSAFGNNTDPLFSATVTDEYRQLYRRITELTPHPLKSLLESGVPGTASST